MNIQIAFFTGTGGTRLAARQFEKEFSSKDHNVEMTEIRHDSPRTEGEWDLLLLCYAVHAGSAPLPVLNWLSSLNPVDNTPAAVVSVSCGGEMTPNLACRVRAKRRLNHKGYNVFYENMIIMPSNWYMTTPMPFIDPILNRMPGKVAFRAQQIMEGNRRHTRAGIGNRIIECLGRLEHIGARKFGRGIRVEGNCIGCGICKKVCPTGNIGILDGKPSIGNSCIMCMACLYRCPVHALTPTRIESARLKDGYDLHKMLKERGAVPAYTTNKDTEKKIWKGVREYLENRGDEKEPVSAAQGMGLEETKHL